MQKEYLIKNICAILEQQIHTDLPSGAYVLKLNFNIEKDSTFLCAFPEIEERPPSS